MDKEAVLDSLKKTELHKFTILGKTILFNVNTLLYYEIDGATNDFIDLLEDGLPIEGAIQRLKAKYSEEEIGNAVDDLRGAQFLIPSDQEIKVDLPEIEYAPRSVTKINFNISHDCNLVCRYCFGKEGNHPAKTGRPFGRVIANKDVAKRTIDWLIKEAGREVDQIQIGCFGGEPLLNFELIKFLVSYGKEVSAMYNKEILISMTTNGVLLRDEILDYILDHNIFLIISFDGPKGITDFNRIFPDGRGSYDVVASNLNKLLSARPHQVVARATYTRLNMEQGISLKEVAEHALDLGFGSINICLMTERNIEGCFLPEDIETLKERFNEAALYFLENIKNKRYVNFGNLTRHISATKFIMGKKLSYCCAAGRDFACVTANGDVYICHRFTGMDEWRMGNIFSSVPKDLTELVITNSNLDRKEGCKECWVRYLCGGMCLKIQLEATDSPWSPDLELTCEIWKYEIMLGMYLNAVLKDQDREIVEMAYRPPDFFYID